MRVKIVFAVTVLGFLLGCREVYKVGFTHKKQEPPPRIMVGGELPFYRVWDWVELTSKTSVRPQGAWMGYAWKVSGPEGGTVDWRYRQDPETGVELADKVWVRFHKPGKWQIQLFTAPHVPMVCTNPECRASFPNLPYRGGVSLVCPACKTQRLVPKVDTQGGRWKAKPVASRPEEILIIEVGPVRFIDGDPKKGVDTRPLVSVFPEGGWVYVGMRFQVSLFGVVMHTNGGKDVVWPRDRVIKKIQIDFGDGTKVEEYINESDAQEIRHHLIDHIYLENGCYDIKATITDSKGNEYVRERVVLAADEPTSGYDNLVGSIIEKLMNTETGRQLVGKNVIIYNLENLETYSDRDALHPIEDQMIQQFHKADVKVLERDDEVLRRWAPEVFGVMPNSFSTDLQMCSPAEWSEYGETLKLETARPDYLVEYRIVEENERREMVRRFNEIRNTWEIVTTEGGADFGVAKLRKRVLKMYFRIVEGRVGTDSTRVLFTDIMSGSSEDFVVEGAGRSSVRRSGGAGGASVQGSTTRRIRCPQCGAINLAEGVVRGDRVVCYKCKHEIPVK